MAEIRGGRKRPTLWQWIDLAAAVVIAVVLWGYVRMSNAPEKYAHQQAAEAETPRAVPTTGSGPAVAAPVNEYLTFVKDPQVERGLEHDYIAAGIRKLTTALAALARDPALNAELAALRQNAYRIQENPQALTHSKQTREMFSAAASLMSRVQRPQAASAQELRDQIATVREAAEAVRVNRRLLQQKTEVERFFAAAGDAVTMLNEVL